METLANAVKLMTLAGIAYLVITHAADVGRVLSALVGTIRGAIAVGTR